MGKSTISTGPFSIAMLNYQRVTMVAVTFMVSNLLHPAWYLEAVSY
jgi:hypothetical protein